MSSLKQSEARLRMSKQRMPSPTHMDHSSPTRYDVDFYMKKCDRLEEDIMLMGDELNRARIRLRKAEDFEIKYELLSKQKLAADEELVRKDAELVMLCAKNQQLVINWEENVRKLEEVEIDRQSLAAELQLWKEKALESQDKMKIIASDEEKKAAFMIENEVAAMRRGFIEAEADYKFQLARLNKQVSERSSLQHQLQDKHDKYSKQKDKQIVRLEAVIAKSREELLAVVADKNAEIEKIKSKFQNMLETQIGSLQKNMNTQDSRFELELKGLRAIVEMKNQEIGILQKEQKDLLGQNAKEREAANSEMVLLKDKIYDIERENEMELFNMKERLTKLHEMDIEAITKRYEELLDTLRKERLDCQELMKEKDRKMQENRLEYERGRKDLMGIIKDREQTIREQKQGSSHITNSSTTEINNLHASLAKTVSEKQTLTAEYQVNISFFNQQITKLINSNELKNEEIKSLHEEIAHLKKESFEIMRDLEARWKAERKEREAEREKQRNEREKCDQEFREKEIAWKNKQREFQRNIEALRREKNRLIANVQKLEREIERLNKQVGTLSENYKKELNRNQLNSLGTDGIRRELSIELDKQRVDFEEQKRCELNEQQKRFELQLTRLVNHNERLQHQLQAKNMAYDTLQQEYEKVANQHKNVQKINRQKIAEYHKKMNALNSEILLTQNLYQSFIEAKSRVVHRSDS